MPLETLSLDGYLGYGNASYTNVQLKNPAGWSFSKNHGVHPTRREVAKNVLGKLKLIFYLAHGTAFLAHGHGQVNMSSHSARRQRLRAQGFSDGMLECWKDGIMGQGL